MIKENATKVYVAFFGLSKDLSNKAVSMLRSKCREVKFVGETQIDYGGKNALDYSIQVNPEAYANDGKSNSVLKEIENTKENLAGLILFFGGSCDKRFFLTGLPTIIVDVNPFPSLQVGFKGAIAEAKINETNFLAASYSDFDASESAASARIQDLVEKIGLFKVINEMKNTIILDVQVKGFGTKSHEHWWRLNQELYLNRLKQYLGMDAVILDYRDFFKAYGGISEKEAKTLAQKWIAGQTPTKAIKNKRNVGRLTEKGAATVMRVNVLKRKISVLTGEVIPGESVWKNFKDYSCCTKVAVKTNAKQVYQNFDYGTFTNHQLLFYSDHRQKIKDLAKLTDFEVVEEDR